MLRYGNEIYSEKQLRKTRPEKQRTKEERRAIRDVKRARETHNGLQQRLKLAETYERDAVPAVKEQLSEAEQMLLLSEAVYREYTNEMNALPQRRFPAKRKKQKPETVYKAIQKLITEKKAAGNDGLTKEETAQRLNCPEYQIEQAFMRLNREGILHQAEHRIPHDCDRNTWNGTSGWMSDWYRFRKEENK